MTTTATHRSAAGDHPLFREMFFFIPKPEESWALPKHWITVDCVNVETGSFHENENCFISSLSVQCFAACPKRNPTKKNPNPMGDPKIFLKSTESTELSSQVNALYSGKAAEAELDVAVAWPVRGHP